MPKKADAKKAWRKPTVSTMEGIIGVESGSTQSPQNIENATYQPPS